MRAEIGRFEAAGREAEQKLARFDLAGMQAGAEEANELVRLRAFSWSRFLTRLEKTLPNDVRVVSVSLSKADAAKVRREGSPRRGLLRRRPVARVARSRRASEADPGLLRLPVVRRADPRLRDRR